MCICPHHIFVLLKWKGILWPPNHHILFSYITLQVEFCFIWKYHLSWGTYCSCPALKQKNVLNTNSLTYYEEESKSNLNIFY
jgi:hypothetical protein